MAPSLLLALRLVLVYPGAPGSPQEAQEFLKTLGVYLEQRAKLPAGTLVVAFHNEATPGMAAVREPPGAIAVVTLPALCGAGVTSYKYLCSPSMAGHNTETVSLMVKAGGGIETTGDIATSLKGRRLAGPLLAFPEYVNRLVLGGRIDVARDTTIVPAPNALLAVKAVRDGQADVAVLTQTQVEALDGVVAKGTLAPIFTSGPLPGTPVLIVGEIPGAAAAALAKAFLGMCTDPEGAELCDTMGVSGFHTDGAPALAAALASCWGGTEAPH